MRNFLYNKSDILTAILIILIAVGVVFWRIGVIMNYTGGDAGKTNDFSALILPWTQSDSGSNGANTAAGTDTNAGAAAQAPATGTDAGAGTTAQTPAAGTDAGAGTAAQTPAAATGGTVTFTVNSGDVASVIGDHLAAAGLVNTADDFLAEVNNQNAATSLKAGTFEIPKGSTPAQIVAILTK